MIKFKSLVLRVKSLYESIFFYENMGFEVIEKNIFPETIEAVMIQDRFRLKLLQELNQNGFPRPNIELEFSANNEEDIYHDEAFSLLQESVGFTNVGRDEPVVAGVGFMIDPDGNHFTLIDNDPSPFEEGES